MVILLSYCTFGKSNYIFLEMFKNKTHIPYLNPYLNYCNSNPLVGFLADGR